MNLAVHGLEGDLRIGNSFYDEQPELINRCDFVMANPPFNVDGVNTDQIRKLPCTLWFFDKGKPRQAMANACNSQDRVLMIDARNVYHVESARHHRFSEEQLANLTAIVWLHRGEDHKFRELVANDQWTARKHLGELESTLA